jgi:hypothetical protein
MDSLNNLLQSLSLLTLPLDIPSPAGNYLWHHSFAATMVPATPPPWPLIAIPQVWGTLSQGRCQE